MPASTNLLAHAEAADVSQWLPKPRSLDLIYLDPPYGVGVTMSARTRRGEARGAKGRASGPDAYDDTMGVDPLVTMIAQAALAIRDRMAEHATLYLHLDHRVVHESKIALDRVFGRGAFVGELIWVPGNGARGAGLSMTHQTLLLYARSAAKRRSVIYNSDDPELREPFAATSQRMHFTQTDADGRNFRERKVGGKTYRYYADVGRKRGSVWADIPAMRANTPIGPEGTGYPTQKPLQLLQRIVRASSLPGQLVADLMCGSGTTLVAAALLGRTFAGGDRSAQAIRTTERRLQSAQLPFVRV